MSQKAAPPCVTWWLSGNKVRWDGTGGVVEGGSARSGIAKQNKCSRLEPALSRS